MAGALPRLVVIGLVMGLSCSASIVSASTFSVNPVQIRLSAKTPSTLLTIRNDGDRELRFQLSVFAWDQTPEEQMVLRATDDVVFYPPLLTLRAKEERKIRIGAATGFGVTEQAYRIFVEELPPLAREGEAPQGVAVLTKMGIPIFFEAKRQTGQATLDKLVAGGGRISFNLGNHGTTHFVAAKIVVRGLGQGGDVVFDEEVPGWYVLAGRVRGYQVEVPSQHCGRVVATTVEVRIGTAVLTERVETPALCGAKIGAR